jgi:hypothetical protein
MRSRNAAIKEGTMMISIRKTKINGHFLTAIVLNYYFYKLLIVTFQTLTNI